VTENDKYCLYILLVLILSGTVMILWSVLEDTMYGHTRGVLVPFTETAWYEVVPDPHARTYHIRVPKEKYETDMVDDLRLKMFGTDGIRQAHNNDPYEIYVEKSVVYEWEEIDEKHRELIIEFESTTPEEFKAQAEQEPVDTTGAI